MTFLAGVLNGCATGDGEVAFCIQKVSVTFGTLQSEYKVSLVNQILSQTKDCCACPLLKDDVVWTLSRRYGGRNSAPPPSNTPVPNAF